MGLYLEGGVSYIYNLSLLLALHKFHFLLRVSIVDFDQLIANWGCFLLFWCFMSLWCTTSYSKFLLMEKPGNSIALAICIKTLKKEWNM